MPEFASKKVKKDAYIIGAFWRNISKIALPESIFFEIVGQIAPIIEAFSKSQNTHSHTHHKIYTIIQGKKIKKNRSVLYAHFDGQL